MLVTLSNMSSRRHKSANSPDIRIPATVVRTAPIPLRTAYAVPNELARPAWSKLVGKTQTTRGDKGQDSARFTKFVRVLKTKRHSHLEPINEAQDNPGRATLLLANPRKINCAE